MREGARVYVAGHTGLVGSAVLLRLAREPGLELITRTRAQLDLRDPRATRELFERERPTHVFLCAAKVGGILANSSQPVEFIRDNLQIEMSVLEAAAQARVEKVVSLGSSCIYPRLAPQPIREEYLLSGPLEPTNEWYAIAKIAGLKMIQAYRRQLGFHWISLMPTNLFGPGDNFDLETSHVLPAMIRRFHEAKAQGAASVMLWGTGAPRREFLFIDDCAEAIVFAMDHYDDDSPLNVGVGEDVTIAELAALVREVVGFPGEIRWDTTKPDGTPRKLLDVSRLRALGWTARTPLREGIERSYAWFRASGPGRSIQ